MATNYPGSLDSYSTKVDNVTDVLAAHINDPQDAIVAIETTIGTSGNVGLCEGRLTLATGTPVTTADQTAKTTIYFTPFRGNRISLYDGSSGWDTLEFTEKSVSVPATTTTPFDIWGYNDSGTLALEVLSWTNDTTRATALTTQDGIYVKSGATTRRYLGTGRTTGSSGQTEDSVANRFLWNYYNRVARKLYLANADSHVYGTATWRSWNNDATVRLQFILGVVEDTFRGDVFGTFTPAGDGNQGWVGIGYDSTTSPYIAVYNANVQPGRYGGGAPVGGETLAVGYHYAQALEFASANVTFAGVLLFGTLIG